MPQLLPLEFYMRVQTPSSHVLVIKTFWQLSEQAGHINSMSPCFCSDASYASFSYLIYWASIYSFVKITQTLLSLAFLPSPSQLKRNKSFFPPMCPLPHTFILALLFYNTHLYNSLSHHNMSTLRAELYLVKYPV